MSDAAPRSGRELNMAVSNALQTLSLLRTQALANHIDAAYFAQRLGALEELLVEIDESRKEIGDQGRLAKLYEVSQVIGSSLDLQTVLDQVMDAIIELTGAERGFLMLLDDDGNLKVTVARNFDQETLDNAAVTLSRTVTRRVMDTQQPIVTTNAQSDPRFAGQASIMTHALRSIMATPLRIRGEVIGVVYVDNRIRSGLFNESDLNILDTFARQAAVAIDNARLFSATDAALNARVEELTMLQWIDRQLNETLDTAKAMSITLEWSSRLCNAQSATMALLDQDTKTLHIVSQFTAQDTPGHEASLSLDDPLVGQVIDSQEPALRQAKTSDNGESAWPVFVVPIRLENRVIGVITMTAATDSAFPEESRDLVSRMADRAAIAIENARLYEAVRAANIAKSEFVSLVAHELKVPMTSIMGYADLIAFAGPVNDKQTQFVGTIKNAVNKMKVLVSDLSDISRIESGQLRVNLGNVNVVDAANSAVEGTVTEIEKRQHQLAVEIAPGLPSVRADKDRLTQVLVNLLSNAYKYTPDGGTITLRAEPHRADGVAISVTDSGVGMSAEQLAKLGTKFWRADNGLEQPGTGLGFAITRNLIELMNGKLEIASEPGKGSVFTCILPLAA